ncbi:hypothetical protein JXA70_07125 [candidate division KSB1 bacterium]|nr:hypothetical protein [candidate division KSB1 bacterium]
MIKILDTILKIEQDSKAKVVQAQKKAREIKETAEKENAERLNAARTEAAAFLLESVNNLKKEWEEKYQRVLASQDTKHADFIEKKSNEIEHTADKIVAIITKPQYKNLHD